MRTAPVTDDIDAIAAAVASCVRRDLEDRQEDEMTAQLGMYGLRLPDVVGADQLLTPLPAVAPELRTQVDVGPFEPLRQNELGADRALVKLANGGHVDLRREPPLAVIRLPAATSVQELVHPWLAAACGVTNMWHGKHVLHGAVVARGNAGVAIVGAKMAGKSSLTAALALAGLDVLADDVATIEGDQVHRGPRCVDLRPASVEALEAHGVGQIVRDGERVRVPVAAGPPTVTLRGVVLLEWGDEVTVEALAVEDRLPHLLPHLNNLAMRDVLPDQDLLSLAQFAVWRLRRPKSWSHLPAAVHAVETVMQRSGRGG